MSRDAPVLRPIHPDLEVKMMYFFLPHITAFVNSYSLKSYLLNICYVVEILKPFIYIMLCISHNNLLSRAITFPASQWRNTGDRIIYPRHNAQNRQHGRTLFAEAIDHAIKGSHRIAGGDILDSRWPISE